ncbi:MAG TPA: hypothetical protein ENL35_04945 [Chloroflexi bacterium]|nr:hypothetical protein [Chloroflexota bacterium]
MPEDFTLQIVLDYRNSLVGKLELELAALKRERQRVESSLEHLHRVEYELHVALTREQRCEDLDLISIEQLNQDLKVCTRKIEACLRTIEDLDVSIARKQIELTQAKQDEESIQKLKDAYLKRQKHRLSRLEAIQQDDIYTTQGQRLSLHADWTV